MNANPQSAIPLYFQIEQELASLITSGALAPGSQLPSEEELVQRYGVSRTTVRKAVQELERLGLIEIRRGRGTFVRTEKITQEFTELTGFVEDMVAMGLQPSAKVLGGASRPRQMGWGRPGQKPARRSRANCACRSARRSCKSGGSGWLTTWPCRWTKRICRWIWGDRSWNTTSRSTPYSRSWRGSTTRRCWKRIIGSRRSRPTRSWRRRSVSR